MNASPNSIPRGYVLIRLVRLDDMVRALVLSTRVRCRSKAATARRLGISQRTLDDWLHRWGLTPPEESDHGQI
jgi:hypothetical protein